jgi:hypothetical protein
MLGNLFRYLKLLYSSHVQTKCRLRKHRISPMQLLCPQWRCLCHSLDWNIYAGSWSFSMGWICCPFSHCVYIPTECARNAHLIQGLDKLYFQYWVLSRSNKCIANVSVMGIWTGQLSLSPTHCFLYYLHPESMRHYILDLFHANCC